MMAYLPTTLDNPWNPFTNFYEWYAFDKSHGYNTLEYLARISKASRVMPPELETQAINQAVDEICRLNLRGIYTKVGYEETFEAPKEAKKAMGGG